jgi:hypothetical protein
MRLTLERTKTVEVPNDPDKGFIKIKLLSMEELAEIEAKSSETGITSDGEAKMVIKPYERANKVAEACLIDWGNFYDELGKPIPFSYKKISKVAQYVIRGEKDVRFLEWVDDMHQEFMKEVQGEEKVAGKN